MPAFNGIFEGRCTTRCTAGVSDAPQHDLEMIIGSGTHSSEDSNWEAAQMHYWVIADTLATVGKHQGYFVIVHERGDRTYGTFEGTAEEDEVKGKFTFTGGMGKFETITGGGYFFATLMDAEVGIKWNGDYHLMDPEAE